MRPWSRLASEESEAKKALAELEKLDIASIEFGTTLLALQTAVLAHAQVEERQEFEKPADEANEKEPQDARGRSGRGDCTPVLTLG